jgi:hypothetical protein
MAQIQQQQDTGTPAGLVLLVKYYRLVQMVQIYLLVGLAGLKING